MATQFAPTGHFVVYKDEYGDIRTRFTDDKGHVLKMQPGRVIGIKPRKEELAAARAALARLDAKSAAGVSD